jgi:NAD-dependent SIR2 family protein deacetylase
MDSKDKLLQIFTQNIDGLEHAAGVDDEIIVKCHGSWDTATCITCKGTVNANQYLPVVHAGNLPLCACAKPTEPSTESTKATRPRKQSSANANVEYLESRPPDEADSSIKPALKFSGKKRKRRDSDDESDASESLGRPGLLKPDITFFSEGISSNFRPAVNKIKPQVDLLIIIGTSLPVEPVNLLPFDIPPEVPQIWISNERCKREGLSVDIQLLGDCNLVVEELCRQAGWTNGLLNRLWKNNIGSNLQAKEALQLRNMAAVMANAAVKAKPEQPETLSLRPAQPAQSTEGKSVNGKPEEKKVVKQEVKKDKGQAKEAEKAKAKKLPESKVKVEEVLGYDYMWSIKPVSGHV